MLVVENNLKILCSAAVFLLTLTLGHPVAWAVSPPNDTGSASSFAGSEQGVADGGSTANSNSSQSDQIGEIVVTAQKRAQSIDEVGIAITALSSDQLKSQGINGLADLVKADPSFVVTNSEWGAPVYQIRGVSYNDYSLSASPTVSVYSDEIPYAYPLMSKGATFDLDRVEVLKGPQGTLYGQNATGGAVNYIAAKPTDTFHAGAEATYSRFGAVNLTGFVSGPLTDTLTARFSFNTDSGGAWQQSYTRNDSLGNKDDQFARLLLNWTPTEKLTVLVNFNMWEDHSEQQAGQLIGIYETIPSFAAERPLVTGAPVAPANNRAADWEPGYHPSNDERYYQGSLRADYRFTDHVTLTYLGSYENYTQNDLQDPTGDTNTYLQRQVGTISSNSQEVRLSGDMPDAHMNWLLGGNYVRSITDENQDIDVSGGTVAAAYEGLEEAVGLAPNIISTFDNRSTDNSVAEAAFGNLEFHPIDALGLHAGARYTETDIHHASCSFADGTGFAEALTAYETLFQSLSPNPAGVTPINPQGCTTLGPTLQPLYYRQSLNQDNVSWRVGADWTPIDKTLVYASISRGFKAGDFPTLSASSYLAERPAVQESILAYELGTKSRLLDNRLEVTGSVFLYEYNDKQFEMREPFPVVGDLNTLINVPRSRETGVELMVKYLPTSHVALNFRSTYLATKVTSDYQGFNQFSSIPIDLKGETFPGVPKWALGGDAEYHWDLNEHYSAFVGVDTRYQTQSQGQFGSYEALSAGYVSTPSALNPTTPPVQPGSLSTVIDAYAVTDLRAGMVSRDGHWRYEAFGSNVTNKYYWTAARVTGDSVVRFTGLPAIYGIRVAYKY